MTSTTTDTPGPTGRFSIGGELPVTRLGFGAMRLPTGPGPGREAAIAVARRAVDLGVTLIDTAHLYGWGANEELLAEALFPYPDDLLITTKAGVTRSGPEGWACDGRPESLREQVEQGLRRLRTERVGLLQLHRIDPAVPVAEQVGALSDLRREGKIGHIGLSEVTTAQLAEPPDRRDRQRAEPLQPPRPGVRAGPGGVRGRRYRLPSLAARRRGIRRGPGSRARHGRGCRHGARRHRAPGPARMAAGPFPGRPADPRNRLDHLEQNVAAAGLRLTDSQLRRLDRAAGAAQPRSEGPGSRPAP